MWKPTLILVAGCLLPAVGLIAQDEAPEGQTNPAPRQLYEGPDLIEAFNPWMHGRSFIDVLALQSFFQRPPSAAIDPPPKKDAEFEFAAERVDDRHEGLVATVAMTRHQP